MWIFLGSLLIGKITTVTVVNATNTASNCLLKKPQVSAGLFQQPVKDENPEIAVTVSCFESSNNTDHRLAVVATIDSTQNEHSTRNRENHLDRKCDATATRMIARHAHREPDENN